MSTWADRLGVFDLETTGVDVETARVVTACIAVLDANGDVIERWDWMADPGIDIPEAAAAVHGISTERARAEGRESSVVIAEITQTLRTLFALGIPVVIYNAPYDLSLLDRECRRNELEPLANPLPVIDPLVLDKHVDTYRRGKRTLEVAAAHYGVTLDDAHDAGADAIAAGRVAQALVAARPDELDVPAADLHGRQEIWYAEQARSFQDYVRRQRGDASFVASTAWPLRYPEHPAAFRDTRPVPPIAERLMRTSGDVQAGAANASQPSDDAPTSAAPAQQADAASRSPRRSTTLRVAAGIVTDDRGRTLLVRKRGTTSFMQPGGKMEPGESAIRTLSRELAEEVGVELETTNAEYLGLYRAEAANEPDAQVVAAVFALEIDGEVHASNEIEELLWVDDIERDLAGRDVAPLTRDELLPIWERRRAQRSAR